MNVAKSIGADRAMARLIEGNKRYIDAQLPCGDISPEIRARTCREGQDPYAVIITCSDSRVIPECIFSAGIGELFIIRVAGNVIDKHQLGSVEYAVDHLGCRLVVVLGHTHCGAVGAALHDEPGGFVSSITDEIRRAVGDEKDERRACILNVERSARTISENIGACRDGTVSVVGALYDIEDGRTEFL